MEKKSKKIKNLIKGIVSGKIDVPNESLIFLDPTTFIEVFTKKRMELIELINQFKPESIQELVDITGRKKQAINRDIKILERHELIELKKEGRIVCPKIEKKLLIFGLTGLYSLDDVKKISKPDSLKIQIKRELNKEDVIEAQVFIDGINVNQEINDLRW